MALPAAGELLTFNDVNVHLKRNGTNALTLNDSQVRGLAVKPSGAISMYDLGGKWAGSKLTAGIGGGNYGYTRGSYGAFDLEFANRQLEYMYHNSTSNKILMGTRAGYGAVEDAPTSRTLIVRDVNFNAVATIGLTVWVWTDFGNLWYCESTSTVSNPFPNGAVRWITW